MKMSACITINKRSIQDLTAVFGTMEDQDYDEFIIVLDRPLREVADHCRDFWKSDPRVRFVEIEGKPGWISPVRAWNAGFDAISCDAVYCFSSETLQIPGNLERAKAILKDEDVVIHGKATCSCGPDGHEVNWGGEAPGNLLCDSNHPRPLGFIWAAPMEKVRAIGGYDDAFADGLWYDDVDFFLRLWNTGLGFQFDDSIHGVHLHHERPGLNTMVGQEGIARNQSLMMTKHGDTHVWPTLEKMTSYGPGITRWRHF